MSRTEITLEAEMQREARGRVHELGISPAEYLRRLGERDLTRPRAVTKIDRVFDLGNSGGADIAKDKDSVIFAASQAWKQYTRAILVRSIKRDRHVLKRIVLAGSGLPNCGPHQLCRDAPSWH